MNHAFLMAPLALLVIGAAAYAEDPPASSVPELPRTHVDTTVVDSSTPADASTDAGSTALENDHHFEAGAPEIVRLTNQLHLSAQQQSQLNAIIERADAGAAALIKREHDVRDMIAATTPADPLYAKLVADQSAGASRWKENRESLRHDVLELLTPAQRTRFESLEAAH
jgi:Spy/CpxP family protein refolding chaperone